MLFPTLVIITVAGYAVAGGLSWRSLRKTAPHWPIFATAGVALACHLTVLAHGSLQAHSLVIGMGSALSLFAWQAALLLLLFNLRQPIAALGMVIYPMAAIGVVANIVLPVGDNPTEPLAWPIQAHILLSLLAYGLLTLGAVQATILAVQHRQLHDHRPRGAVAGLPPLETMERVLFQLIGAGFCLLTLAIASGAFFIDHLFAQHLVHKTVLSITAWIFFAVLLWGRWRFGWRGRVAIRWTLSGYVLLILAYFGSKLVLELILGEHWHLT